MAMTPEHITNCAVCGRVIDTRERENGGDDFGCQMSSGEWVCSSECSVEAQLAASEAARIAAEAKVTDLRAQLSQANQDAGRWQGKAEMIELRADLQETAP